jgi:predicted RNase H-like HicB family nuclease
MDKPPLYVVSNGRLVLHLEPAEEGGYVVTSPFDPALITEAETIEEAFEMAEDAAQTLAEGRAKLARRAGGRGIKTRRKTASRT